MNAYKKPIVLLLPVLVILILVLVRLSSQNLFKTEAGIAVEESKGMKNILSFRSLEKPGSGYLIVDLTGEDSFRLREFENTIQIPFATLLDKTNREILKNSGEKIILYAPDPSVPAKAWIILNQLGYKNVYILTEEDNPEVLKYEFQPDTTIRLESVIL